jgi:triosephosphate isomerase
MTIEQFRFAILLPTIFSMNKKKRLFLGANWKMNTMPTGALDTESPYRSTKSIEITVMPTFLDLQTCIEAGLTVGAQCGRAEEKGAFTGDISLHQIKEIGCRYVLCGHSEQRKNHGATDEDIAKQVMTAIKLGIIPILCIGETAEENSRGETNDVLTRQLSLLLQSHSSELPPSSMDYGRAGTAQNFIVAYEPAWAIGTGTPANLHDIAEIHRFIRSLLPTADIKILYGASLNASNAEKILSLQDVDGGLIGGASLKPDEFRKIVEIAASIAR